jgi:hypothetical protein
MRVSAGCACAWVVSSAHEIAAAVANAPKLRVQQMLAYGEFFRLTGRIYLGPLTMVLIFITVLLSNTVCYLPF